VAPSSSSADILRRPEVSADAIVGISEKLEKLPPSDRRVVAEEIKYAGYIARQRREAERMAKAGSRRIPTEFTYGELSGLSAELVEKLDRVRPDTLGRASRIDGMTPAALALLAVHLERDPGQRGRRDRHRLHDHERPPTTPGRGTAPSDTAGATNP
jgi:tRNA uridine 5-carboxymethylaminomethyl modification enzyme